MGEGLTHWGRVMHICVSKLTVIGSDNGLSPGRRQAIIWTNVGILSIESLGTNSCEILIAIHIFPFTKMHLKMLSAKWRPFCLSLNLLIQPLGTNFSEIWIKIKHFFFQQWLELRKTNLSEIWIWSPLYVHPSNWVTHMGISKLSHDWLKL